MLPQRLVQIQKQGLLSLVQNIQLRSSLPPLTDSLMRRAIPVECYMSSTLCWGLSQSLFGIAARRWSLSSIIQSSLLYAEMQILLWRRKPVAQHSVHRCLRKEAKNSRFPFQLKCQEESGISRQLTKYKENLSSQKFDSISGSMAQAKGNITCSHLAFPSTEQSTAS